MSPSRASHKARLDNLQKQISIYSKERAHLQSKIQTLSLDNEIKLEENIKKQEEKLALLVKENLKLNKFGNFNLPPITKTMESEEDLLREIKIFQKSISGLEETIKNQSEKLKNESEKSLELENVVGKQSKYLNSNKNTFAEMIEELERLHKENEVLRLEKQETIEVNEKILKYYKLDKAL